MVKNKRWGKEHQDNRDWKIENKKYEVRGEFLLDFDWAKNWNGDLKNMNRGKRGAPFQFPEAFIELLAVWSQWLAFRELQGITKKFQEYNLIPKEADYTTINIRVNKINTSFELPKEGNISISTDGSGMKMTNRGEYKEKKYGTGKKKYLKVTISANPYNKKLMDIDVSIDGEGKSEPQVAAEHMINLIKKGFTIDRFFGDGSFDVHELFDLLDKNMVKSSIKLRKNAKLSDDGKGSWKRNQEILKYREKGYKKWAEDNEYGRRWPGTEGIFSAVKRIFGENTRSRRKENQIHEVKRKFWAYDKISEYAKT